jgi:glycosyltransferase involved in cell wall biosynthesis
MLSVIMAVYNGEKYLREAILSILEQTYDDFELVIVNDGSTDQTRNILDQFANKANIIHLEKNQGAAAALNIAASHAKGDWLTVHDADDISLPTRLEEQVRNMDPHYSAVGTLIECITGDPPVSLEKLKEIEDHFNNYQTAQDLINVRFIGNPNCHGTMMYSKDLFQRVGGYNPKYKIAYDYDLWMRFMREKPIVKIPKVLYKWRVQENSLHRKNEGQTCMEMMQIASDNIKLLTPRVAVFGCERGCESYRSAIQEIDGLQIAQYVTRPSLKNIKDVIGSLHLNQLDGVIVLESNFHHKVLRYLEKAGLIYNYNLFYLWNVFK